jgi:competence protein ComEA
MIRRLIALLAFLFAATAFAAVDVNKATVAELDGIKGIGPAMSRRILDERKKGHFKSWDDLIARVKGVRGSNATRYSSEGLTVNGDAYQAVEAPATPAK